MRNKTKHSINAETNISGSSRFLPLGGRLGGGLLVLLLLLVASYAFALDENTAAVPYLNSTQLYRIVMGDAANNVTWEIDNGGSDLRDLGNVVWADTSRSSGNHEVEITFVDSLFTNGSSWTLTYSEYDVGSGNCIAVRSFTITPVTNTFYLSMPSDVSPDCNPLSGTVIANNIDLGANTTISTPFDVHMNKSTDFRVKQWSFNGSFSLDNSYTVDNPVISTVSGVTNRGYAWAISNVVGNSFTLTVSLTGPEVAENYTGDTLTFYANFVGVPSSDVNITLTISNGEAQSGNSYTKVTADNTSLGIDRVFTIGYLGIPDTPSITYSQ